MSRIKVSDGQKNISIKNFTKKIEMNAVTSRNKIYHINFFNVVISSTADRFEKSNPKIFTRIS